MKGDTEEIRKTRSINFTIIKEFWKFINPKEVNELYALLDLKRNYYSRIINLDEEIGNLANKWKKKKCDEETGELKEVGLFVLGLPEEYLYGYRMIEIEGMSAKDYVYGNDIESFKIIFDKMKQSGVNVRSTHVIDRIHYFCVHKEMNLYEIDKDYEITELNNQLARLENHMWKNCDIELLGQTIEIMENKLREAKITFDYRNMN